MEMNKDAVLIARLVQYHVAELRQGLDDPGQLPSQRVRNLVESGYS